jgi:chorismate-pyruvate lyase
MSSSPAVAPGPVELADLDDTSAARRKAAAALARLDAELAAQDSATAVLQAWCAEHGQATPIRAVRVAGTDKPADAAVRDALGAGPDDPVRYRHVKLACGERVLSEADNWYRPDLLTDEMNRLLDETETPFGVAVRALGYHRRTMAAETLFDPLAQAAPPAVMRRKAVLSLADGTAFSLVVETYTDKVLFAAP